MDDAWSLVTLAKVAGASAGFAVLAAVSDAMAARHRSGLLGFVTTASVVGALISGAFAVLYALPLLALVAVGAFGVGLVILVVRVVDAWAEALLVRGPDHHRVDPSMNREISPGTRVRVTLALRRPCHPCPFRLVPVEGELGTVDHVKADGRSHPYVVQLDATVPPFGERWVDSFSADELEPIADA